MKLKTLFPIFLMALCLIGCSSGDEDIQPDPTPEELGDYTADKLGFSYKDFDPLSIFTDMTCTELKAGVTDEDIKACNVPFYKRLAQYLKAGKYPKEFRVQEYKAYPHPDMMAATHKTSPYSLLDNPTGMAVTSGDELIIFVGETNGESLQIRIQDLNRPDDDGFNSTAIPLRIIPCSGIGERKLICGFVPEKIEIEKTAVRAVVAAVADHSFGGFDGIVPSSLCNK